MHEIEQTKRIKGGCFKRMNLEIQLERNIHFSNPTPIQRKTLPLVLEGRSLIGIARTGSGKTLCYLLPAIQFAVRNKSTLILVPTKELAYQIRKQLKIYRYKIEFSGRILITTPNDRVDLDQFDMLVVVEFDRILEEESLRK
ncbi:DBP10 [Enterospora canceri]|uniref:ATP-dependent RNA helicase n=1 Tax=Enterospora canceri TaxID=1081671 RepID=A0A1Y1S6S3_9MICR|nr:DBP10 [Enterospora canceri]